MRLVCPNCGAQYEVDDRVIPHGGRDVQCSACGHGWYQMPAGREDEAADDEPQVDEQLAGEEAETEADEPEDLTFDEALTEDELADEDTPDDEQTVVPPAMAARPRAIDEGIRSILQEEAQRELEARAAAPKPAPVETQPELGLESGPSPEEERRRIARERMARMRGIDEDDLPEPDFDAHAEAAETASRSAQGRDLFPDIEEINSTLDSHAPGAASGEERTAVAAGRSRGFSRGFVLVLALAALALALYVLAPNLSLRVPMLEPALSGYVEAVNAARIWLDETLRGLIEKIEAAAGEGN